MRSDAPGSARALVMLFAGPALQDSWKDLEYCVRTGAPAFRKVRPDGDAFTTIDVEQTKVFDAAMATFAPITAAAVTAAYDFSQFRSIVDVGGGNGSLLIAILRATTGLEGTVFERPQVVAGTREHVAQAGLADRCRVVSGDFFDSVPGGADAYLLKHVIHDWDDEKARAILATCRRAMHRHAKLLIVEGVYPQRVDDSLASRGAAANDVNMLVATGGRQRSAEEFRELYAASGFELTRIVDTPAASVIEGVPS
jgi:hypothetical protein